MVEGVDGVAMAILEQHDDPYAADFTRLGDKLNRLAESTGIDEGASEIAEWSPTYALARPADHDDELEARAGRVQPVSNLTIAKRRNGLIT